MRHSMRALFGVMLVGWICCAATATETGRKWWQFGQEGEADVAVTPQTTMPPITPQLSPAPATTMSPPLEQPTTTPRGSSVEQPEPHWMISSPLAKVSWPRIHMPVLPKPRLPAAPWSMKTDADSNRNAWAEPDPNPLKPSPMRRFGQSTRAAWDKTIGALTPGDKSTANSFDSRIARRDDRSMWSKMFGANEPIEREGSQTIGEFIAQERVDP